VPANQPSTLGADNTRQPARVPADAYAATADRLTTHHSDTALATHGAGTTEAPGRIPSATTGITGVRRDAQ
jgi:hypothetical protein